MTLSEYQNQQIEALQMVRRYLEQGGAAVRADISARIAAYLDYRRRLDLFLETYFHRVCNLACYQSKASTCCVREAIVTFFAEVVINAMVSSDEDLDRMVERLQRPNSGQKCVYLGPQGCLWQIRPLVCALFVCDPAERQVLAPEASLRRRWQALREEAQSFRWPDRPVLFDDLEQRFIDAGCQSALMYLHLSPGLLNVKRRAALATCPEKGP